MALDFSLLRDRRAEAVVLVAALLMFVSLFLPWFGVSIGGIIGAPEGGRGTSVSATESLFSASVPLAIVVLLAVLAIVTAVGVRITGRRVPGFERPFVALSAAAGVIVVATVYLCMNPPGFGGDGGVIASAIGLTPKVEVGAWLTMIAALATLVAGGVWAGGVFSPGGDEMPVGRLYAAWEHARALPDTQAVVGTLAVGLLSVLVLLVGVLTREAIIIILALPVAVVAVVLGRFATRQAARHDGDGELLYLARFGKIGGWVVVGFAVLLVIIAIVALGHAANDLNGLGNGLSNSGY